MARLILKHPKFNRFSYGTHFFCQDIFFLDIVTTHFFSLPQEFFVSQQDFFFLLQEKIIWDKE